MTHRAGGRVPRGHTKRHTVRASGSNVTPSEWCQGVTPNVTPSMPGACQGVTPNVTPGKAGAVPGGRRRVRGIRTPGADRVGGSLEETSDSEDGRGPGTAQSARRADRTQDVRPGHASSVGKSATERSGAQGPWRSICGFHADRCKFVRFCTRSGSDNPSLALREGTRPGVMRKRYHAERN